MWYAAEVALFFNVAWSGWCLVHVGITLGFDGGFLGCGVVLGVAVLDFVFCCLGLAWTYGVCDSAFDCHLFSM